MRTYAIDFETYYRKKDYGVGELGIYHYLRDERADIYIVSIAGDDGLRFVGHPSLAPWEKIMGEDVVWLSHNVGFDEPVFYRLNELKVAPDLIISNWHDTADLAAYLGFPRSLEQASLHLLGKVISKDTRTQMSGKQWKDMTPEFQGQVEQYALSDAECCLNLWLKHSHKWPEFERQISRHTRQMAYRGVPVDLVAAEAAKEKLSLAVWETEALIPWRDTDKILSPIAIRKACAAEGIWCPASFAKGNEEVERWEEEFSGRFPWIKAVRDYRAAKKHLATVETMIGRTRPDGRMAYGLKYFGAHTGRDSGESGWNAQNLPKGKVCGVDLRALIKAPEGRTFIISDLSQIEPRVIHWLADDTKTLDFIRKCPDLYEAQARAWGLYDKPEPLEEGDPQKRFMLKQLALGLSYGMGANKFQQVSGETPEGAKRLVDLYRSKNPKIVKLWPALEQNLLKTARTEGEKDAVFELPSGRKLHYRNVSVSEGRVSVEIPRQGVMARIATWGGSLAENLCQSVAREVFIYHCERLYSEGLAPIMRIHDEVVIEVPENLAPELQKKVEEIMSTPPEWAQDLPLSSKSKISNTYTK